MFIALAQVEKFRNMLEPKIDGLHEKCTHAEKPQGSFYLCIIPKKNRKASDGTYFAFELLRKKVGRYSGVKFGFDIIIGGRVLKNFPQILSTLKEKTFFANFFFAKFIFANR